MFSFNKILLFYLVVLDTENSLRMSVLVRKVFFLLALMNFLQVALFLLCFHFIFHLFSDTPNSLFSACVE